MPPDEVIGLKTPHTYKWRRFGRGYEVSSRGDKRFSAFFARLPDGETIEYKYQVRVKGYASIKEGKGKPPRDPETDSWAEYLALWRRWAKENPALLDELRQTAALCDYTLTDRFATTDTNQAHALAVVLNETFVHPHQHVLDI